MDTLLTRCRGLFLLLTLLSGVAHGGPASTPEISPELREFSSLIQYFRDGAEKELGISTVYVGGGSSRAVLDHLYYKKPLDMRDVDVFFVAERDVTEEYSQKLGKALEGPILGKFSAIDLRPRPRGNLEVPFPHVYNAGYGFFWINDKGRVFDLSIYHSEKALALNGIFNIDMVMLPVTKDQTILELAEKLAKIPPEAVSTSGLIRDAHLGYSDWIKSEARLVNHAEIIRDPNLQALRSIRTYSKLKKRVLPSEFLQFLKGTIKNAGAPNRLQMGRNLLKLLEDADALNEYRMLIQTGALRGWSPELQSLSERLSPREMGGLFGHPKKVFAPRGPPKALGMLLGIFDRLNPSEKILLLNDLYKVEPQAVIAEVQATLNRAFPHSKGIARNLSRELQACFQAKTCVSVLAHATGSTVLSESDRVNLAVRAFLMDLPQENRAAMFARLSEGALGDWEAFQRRWMVKRVGYYTGVFNPIHLGHVDVVRAAMRDMALDELILMPTPATSHNEVPLDWPTRVAMAKLAFEGEPTVRVVDSSYLKDLEQGTGVAIDRLFRENAGANFTHVMGSDSLERYLQRFGEKELDRKSLYVVARDVSVDEIRKLSSHPNVFVGAPTSNRSIGGSEMERSSTLIRKRLDAGQTIDGLVPAAVERYIKAHRLYRNPENIAPKDCAILLGFAS